MALFFTSSIFWRKFQSASTLPFTDSWSHAYLFLFMIYYLATYGNRLAARAENIRHNYLFCITCIFVNDEFIEHRISFIFYKEIRKSKPNKELLLPLVVKFRSISFSATRYSGKNQETGSMETDVPSFSILSLSPFHELFRSLCFDKRNKDRDIFG